MKRIFLFLLLFIISIALPVGCSTQQSNNSTGTPTSQENIISVYNYSTYIDPAIITEFEKQFGVKVKYDTYESNDELYAKLKAGNPGYDVIVPSDYMITIMSKENLLEELDRENIPNIKNIDNKFLNSPFDPDNRYSIPYQWGTIGLGYNIKKTVKELDSWEALFDPKYKGRVALSDELRDTLGCTLMYLGYDLNTANPDEINKAKDYIIQHKDNIAAFSADNGQILLDQGQVDISMESSGDTFQVMEENPDIRYAIPKEGTIIWIDAMAIPKDAPHQELAQKFINFILQPEIGAKISNFTKYASPNKAAVDKKLVKKEDLENLSIYPAPEIYAKLKFLKDVGDATRFYDEAWTEIKLEIGK